MKKLLLFVCLFTFAFVCSAISSDVANVAQKEKERRAKTKSTKTYTNKDVEDFKKKNKTADDSTQTESATDDEQATGSGEATADQTQAAANDPTSEEYWRNRSKELSDKVADLQAKYDKAQSDLNALQNATYASGGNQLTKNEFTTQMEQRDQLKAELDEAKAALDGLEDEARKAGVPAGWVRQ
ncbi:MAG: hypothetical protein C5B54_07920 [Acidobacteria bacterium]|nr:MAG: hypothetical protein C5B54_07920 [Acidobacteriota bacterium]